MNDPGLDAPIADAANDVNQHKPESHDHDHDHDTFIDEVQNADAQEDVGWWYASTAFPLFAGTFGPMANAFSLCALVENWRVTIPPGGTEEHGHDVHDPRWLIAINAVSLVFALIGNLSLLLNMARRVRFEIAQPCTILGFWMASILLIGLIGYAGTHSWVPAAEDQALTQAFYYAIFAAGLYQILSYLMCVTVWGAYKGAYSKEFKLTIAQRTLMLQTMSFLAYQLLGALVYSYIEKWKYLDALYWSDFTLLTVGIGGAYVPLTHLGRGLLFPFAIGGIIILGLVVGSIRSLVLERGQEKMSARMVEKTRERVVKQVAANRSKGRTLTGLSKDKVKSLRQEPSEDGESEMQRRKIEFEAMRQVQEIASRERAWMSLAISTLCFAFLWTVGAVVFWKAERNQQWTYFESLYFAYTSILTIGYGDFEPMSNSGKPFFVFWSLLAIPALTILISNMGDTVVKGIKDVTIWIGEISVLPSEQGSFLERLKYGFYKATLGKVKQNIKDEEKVEDEGEEWEHFRELHPGLVHLFSNAERKKIHIKDVKLLDRLGKDFEEQEAADEEEAKQQKDRRAEANHHYRRLLISQIRKVYTDTKLADPKKYSYLEWSFYLRLLGEKEADASRHERPPKPSKSRKRQGADDDGDDEEDNNSDERPDSRDDDGAPPKWSWLGDNSPLLAVESEPEWILEKLFQRLEEAMRDQRRENQDRAKTEKKTGNNSHAAASGSDSDRTLSDGGEMRKR